MMRHRIAATLALSLLATPLGAQASDISTHVLDLAQGIGGADIPATLERKDAGPGNGHGGEMFSRKETIDLIQAYYQLGERPRRRLLDLAKSLHATPETA